jgi:hypothetical protein
MVDQPTPGPEPETPPEANGLTATPQRSRTNRRSPADPAAEVGDLGERLRSAEGEAAGAAVWTTADIAVAQNLHLGIDPLDLLRCGRNDPSQVDEQRNRQGRS